MNISTYSATKSELIETVRFLFETEFEIPTSYASRLARKMVWPHIDQLTDSVWILIESPYVDKVFRDSYYNYYSSKSIPYRKDCIRLSFFSEEVAPEMFRDPKCSAIH